MINDNDRIKDLEDRVSQLEKELLVLRRDKTRPVQPINQSIAPNTNKKEKKKIDFEKEIGQIWLPRIFIIVLLLGVIWGFKAGSELGLINEYVRISIGYLIAIVFIVIGHKQWHKQHLVLAQVLLGGSVAILFLTTFATHALYQLISSSIAFSIHLMIVLLGFYLTKYYLSQSIGIVSSIGAFLVPFLLLSGSGNILFFAIYELVIFLTFMVIALHYKQKALFLVVTYGLHFSYFVFAISQWDQDIRTLALAVIIQHIAILFYFLYRDTLKQHLAFTLLSSSVLASIWILTSFTEPFWLLVFTLAYFILVAFMKMDNTKRAVLISTAALTLVLFLLNQFEQSALGLFLIIEGSIMIYLSHHLQSTLQRWIGFVIYVLGVISILIHPIDQLLSLETLAWTALLTSFILHYKINHSFKAKHDIAAFVKTVISLIGLIYLSQLTVLLTNLIEFKSMVLSITWIIYAASYVIYGYFKKDKFSRLFGISMIFITLLKVIFVDLPTVSILVRAILFLLLGFIGISVSRLFYKKENERSLDE